MTNESQTPVEEASEAEAPTGKLTSEMTDEEIMAAIQAQQAARAAQAPQQRQTTLQDLYFSMTALVKTEARLPRAGKLSEQSAVKLLELALMWALNTRNSGPAPVLNEDIPTEEIGGESGEIAPDEAIGFDTTTEEDAA